MLSRQRPERLARRAARRRGDGTRGIVARWAWERLVRAGDRGDQAAADVLWEGWLGDPDEERWDVLARWRGPVALADAAFEAAVDPGRDGGAREAIGVFWAGRGLVPDGAVARALFFVMTGQAAQHRAADPDGSLLASAYRGADEATRAALRGALAGAGDLDLVRVVAGEPHGRAARMSGDEIGYLAGQLAGRRDWAGLWRLVRDIPLADAIAAMPAFGDGWRPAEDRGGALFERMARSEPGEIARARDALAASAPTHLVLDGELYWQWLPSPGCGSFSPDGRELAVAAETSAVSGVIHVFELPGGTLAEQHEVSLRPSRVLHLGGSILASGPVDGTYRRHGLVRSAGGRATKLLWSSHTLLDLAPYRPGFVVLYRLGTGSAEHMRFCANDGEVVRDVPLAGLGLPDQYCRVLAVGPGSRSLALSLADRLWIMGGDPARVLASGRADAPIEAACFAGPDRVATLTHGGPGLQLWRLDGGRLELEATRSRAHELNPVALHVQGMIAVRRGWGAELLDAKTLLPTRERPFAGVSGRYLWGSPDGRRLAFAGEGFVDVVVPGLPASVTALAAQPLAAMSPADLAAVTDLLGDSVTGPAARPFLVLLHDILEYRFGADVGIGTAIPAVGEDEISLQARERRAT